LPRDLTGPLAGLRLLIPVNTMLALTLSNNGDLNTGWPDI
jgi:hypothetical protein